MQTKEAIQALSFFGTLTEADTMQLLSIAHIENYPERYILYYENTQTTRILFLVKGLAKAYKIDKHDNEIFLYHVHPNSLLSEISSLDKEALLSYANIIIEEDATILSIDYAKFQKYFIDTGLLSRELASEVIQQSKQLQAIVNREFIFDSVSKVAMLLEHDLEIFNKLKRYDVSLMLHIQPATLSRVLNRLKRDEMIDIDKGNIIILDHERLQHIYKGFL